MSRTKKGSKHVLAEYETRRPGNVGGSFYTGPSVKTRTHRAERRLGKAECANESDRPKPSNVSLGCVFYEWDLDP